MRRRTTPAWPPCAHTWKTVLRGLGVAVERPGTGRVSGELPAFDPTMKRRRIRRLALTHEPFSMTARSRLLHLLAGWGSVGLVYFSSDLLQGQGVLLPETAIDRAIAYSDAAIWLYLSFFILIPYAYLVADAARVRWLARAMALSALICGVVFLLYPTTLAYPPVGDGSAWSTQVLRMLQAADSTQNCLPSLHGALTLLCVWALVRQTPPGALRAGRAAGLAHLLRHHRAAPACQHRPGRRPAVGMAGGMLAKMQVSSADRRAISTEIAS